MPDHTRTTLQDDPIVQGLAFEARPGRPAAPWKRALAPFGVFYTYRGLRALVALTRGKDGFDRATVAVSRLDGRGQPDIAQLAAVRQDFFPVDMTVRARWSVLAGERVMVLEAVVPAEEQAMRRAS